MGQGPDLMSNWEQDDSAFCIFTHFFGNGWETKLKKCLVHFWGMLQCVPHHFRNILADSHLDSSESKMCRVSWVVCSKHFKPDYFALHLDFKGEIGILSPSITLWLVHIIAFEFWPKDFITHPNGPVDSIWKTLCSYGNSTAHANNH